MHVKIYIPTCLTLELKKALIDMNEMLNDLSSDNIGDFNLNFWKIETLKREINNFYIDQLFVIKSV